MFFFLNSGGDMLKEHEKATNNKGHKRSITELMVLVSSPIRIAGLLCWLAKPITLTISKITW